MALRITRAQAKALQTGGASQPKKPKLKTPLTAWRNKPRVYKIGGKPLAKPHLKQMFRAFGIPDPLCEYIFTTERGWRFDFAWPNGKIALEVEGGIWTRGRHTRGKGFFADMEKYNRAMILGWRVLRCSPDDLVSWMAGYMLREFFVDEDEKRMRP
jgi:hypothetical protein